MRSLLAGGALLFALGGCGSSGDEGDPSPPWEPGQVCPKDRVALAGQLDSSPVEVTVKHGGYEFNQGVDPKTLWIVISDGKLDMTWTELLPYG